MKSNPLAVAAGLMFLAGSAATNTATSQAATTRAYTEGSIGVTTYVKTKPGMFDRYMAYLDGPYKTEMEAEKAAGIIQDYMILTSEARTPADHDVMLIVVYKNWAALDGLQDRTDAIANRALQSTPQQRDQQFIDRGAMREILGNRTYQRLMLR
jgi:hypothetical protein